MRPQKEESDAVWPKGNRLLGLHITDGRGVDYGTAFALAKSVGVQVILLSLNWSDIEKRPGVYDSPFLAIANGYYPPRKTALHVVLRTIDTVRRTVPADLATTSWDAPEMADRFAGLLDYVLGGLKDTALVTLAIGNEVDTVLNTERSWRAYRVFLERARDSVRRRRPDLAVGVTLAGKAPLDPMNRDGVDGLLAASDAALVTYYPLRDDFTVRAPESPLTDFDALAKRTAKPLHLIEAGYPSSAACRSSEAMQEQFVASVFRAWDRQADRIHSVSFAWEADCTAAEVATFLRYYGVSGAPFREYLATLGLRTNTNRDKLAWTTLQREARSRGW